jgi:hypothetical protein
MWSDDEGSEDENKEITESENEDGSEYEGGEWEGESGSNDHVDSNVTGSGGNKIIIRGTNGYKLSVNEPKRMGQSPRKNTPVIQPGNKCEAPNCMTPTEAWNLLFADSILQKVLRHVNYETARTAAYKQKRSYNDQRMN